MSTWITDVQPYVWLYIDSVDPNIGSHTGSAST